MSMRRKVRKNRQIRIQDLKRQRNREHSAIKEWEEKMIENLLHKHPYYSFSDLSCYIFIYVELHYGWEMFEPKRMVFLYDKLSHKINYSRLLVDVHNENYHRPIFHISCENIGYTYSYTDISFEKMLNCNPQKLIQVYDSAYYRIYIKNREQRRYLGIAVDNVSLYGPYAWLIRLFNDISNGD